MMTFNQKMKCIASDFFIELKIADDNLEHSCSKQGSCIYICLFCVAKCLLEHQNL